MADENSKAYWRANLRLLAALLVVWFAVSYGAGILFVDELDAFRFAGFKLGFFMAQQGSIYVFVALIFVYVRAMNRNDAKYFGKQASGETGSQRADAAESGGRHSP
jgi:putative solute:sodium symporter small subunit